MTNILANLFPKNFGTVEASILVASGALCYILVRRFRRRRFTRLRGPSSSNFLFGLMRHTIRAPDSGAVYEEWANEYGAVFLVPHIFGSKKLVLADPKAVAHFFTKETYGYVQTTQSKRLIERLIGRGLFYAEGESHKRCVPFSKDTELCRREFRAGSAGR